MILFNNTVLYSHELVLFINIYTHKNMSSSQKKNRQQYCKLTIQHEKYAIESQPAGFKQVFIVLAKKEKIFGKI